MPSYESRYAGRRPDGAVVNLTMDQEALDILERFCPRGRKNLGSFVARLVYEHAARVEERQRLVKLLERDSSYEPAQQS